MPGQDTVTRRAFAALLPALGLLLSGGAFGATITVVNMDGPGEGLNDMTVVTPIGGNTATTLGQARLNVLNEAANIWAQRITSSQTIVVEAKFDAMECDATSGVLGSTGPLYYFTNNAGATGPLPLTGVLYPAALADAITSGNVNSRNDIGATFNSDIWGNSSCLNGRYFYLGFDHQLNAQGHARPDIDLLNTALHEFGHGLGFTSIVKEDGTSYDTSGRLAAFDQCIYDEIQGKYWSQLASTQRSISAKNNGLLVWNGASVNAQIPNMQAGTSNLGVHLRLYAPTIFDEGSSVSHWDTSVRPHLLMEPFITENPNGLTDLTSCVFRDIGWPGVRCPDTGNSNVTPVAVAQALATTINTAIPITLSGTDQDSTGLLTYSVVTQPTLGTLTVLAPANCAGSVSYTYTPNANATGTDSFTFQAYDGISTSLPAQVSITISAPAPQQSAGGGGGGSIGLLWLACLASLGVFAYARRRQSCPG